MFIKVSKSKNYSYVQVVSSYRENNVVKHKLIANLGRFDSLIENQTLINLGNKLLSLAGRKPLDSFFMKEIDRFCYGDIPYSKLWKKLKLDDILQFIKRNKKIKFHFPLVTYLMVISRLLDPQSKYSLYLNQNKYINIAKVSLQYLYRSLDILADGKEILEEYLFERQKNLFNMSIDIVLYDVTTFHFESQRDDELRDFGFSKANKVNETQIVFGLMIDIEGRPIGYNIFKGNKSECKTLEKVLEDMRKRFEIRRIILVADKGLNNAENLHKIKSMGYDYIVSTKIKNSSKELEDKILTTDEYIEVKRVKEEESYKYKIIEPHIIEYKPKGKEKIIITDKLIITWSEKRSISDKKNRERQVKKAKERIEKNQNPINKKGANKYLEIKGDIKVTGINAQKIIEDSRWDGYYGIQTSDSEITVDKVISHYHMLWRVEESFRILKTTFHARPIFHWTEKRIKGHFVVCFLAFLLERNLEIILKSDNIEYSTEKIKKALNTLQISEIEIENERYYLKGKSESFANQILKKFHIKHLRNITPKGELKFE